MIMKLNDSSIICDLLITTVLHYYNRQIYIAQRVLLVRSSICRRVGSFNSIQTNAFLVPGSSFVYIVLL